MTLLINDLLSPLPLQVHGFRVQNRISLRVPLRLAQGSASKASKGIWVRGSWVP